MVAPFGLEALKEQADAAPAPVLPPKSRTLSRRERRLARAATERRAARQAPAVPSLAAKIEELDTPAPRPLPPLTISIPAPKPAPGPKPSPDPEPAPQPELVPAAAAAADVAPALPPIVIAPDVAFTPIVEPSSSITWPALSVPTRRERRVRARRRLTKSLSALSLPSLRFSLRFMAALVFVVVVGGGLFVGIRLQAPVPKAVVTSTLTADALHANAAAPTLPWTPVGQAAIAVPSIGINVTSGPETTAPIASLTKMMTAYVILRDHPLAAGHNGPLIIIHQSDVNDFDNDTVEDQANAQVVLGEVLSERQLLGGMLIHSANNYADTLASWDAGSVAAFVVKMNEAAAQLGMTHTHYADPSGFNPGSESTPSDLLKVAAPDMANATFASLVRQSSITLPVAGLISTYTPLLGVQGVIGVKSGFTSQAGGCDVLAVMRRAHGKNVLILSAVTGEQGPNVLDEAGLQALNTANGVGKMIGATAVIQPGTVVARVSAAGHTVDAAVEGSARVLSWPGVSVTRRFVSSGPVKSDAKAGTKVGSVIVTVGTQRIVLPVRLTRSLPGESLTQRLF